MKSISYYKYLKGRGLFGIIYRFLWLYPFLSFYSRGSILDVGCGIGDFLKFNKKSCGVDINPLLVDYCIGRGLNAKLIKNEIIPYDDSVFDTVVLDNVLEHIKNPNNILLEIYRVLKKNGVFIVGVPGSLGYVSDSDHKVFYTKENLIKIIKKYGYKVKKSRYMPINHKFFDKRLKQHCVYLVFIKKRIDS